MRERSHRLRTALLTLLGMLLIAGSVSSTHAETTLGDGEYVIFYHHDLLGSPTLVSDQHGNTLWHEHSDPYGRAQDRVSETGEEFLHDRTGSRKGYTGHLQDEGTDLVYMKARYYDPQIGRFYSNDPVGFTASNPMMFNRYAYANNNPYRYVDPDGRAAQAAVPVAGYAIYGYAVLGLSAGAALTYGVHQTGRHLGLFSENNNESDDEKGDSKPDNGTTSEKKQRKSVGADGGISEQEIERDDEGNAISRTHTVVRDGEVVHQHQNHIGNSGNERQFPDSWTGTETINAPNENNSQMSDYDRERMNE